MDNHKVERFFETQCTLQATFNSSDTELKDVTQDN